MSNPRIPGRGWAYFGALLGGMVSIAANVAHSYVPPADWKPTPAGTEFTPQPGAVFGAVFWPIALFTAVEILARIPWPAGRRWVALRFGGLLPVAVVAAVVSYRHLSGLLAFYGTEDGLTVAIGPLAVDGLMVMATGALLAIGTRRTATGAAETARLAAVPTPAGQPASIPVATPAVTKPARPRSTRKPPSVDKVAKAAARMPGATVAQVAAKAGVSESTARRYLPAASRPTAAATVASANPPRPAATPVVAAA
jgi:hypothetical protein